MGLLRRALKLDSYVGLLRGTLTWDSYVGLLRGTLGWEEVKATEEERFQEVDVI